MQHWLILSDYGCVNLFHDISVTLLAGRLWQNWDSRPQQLLCCFHWETIECGNRQALALHKQITHKITYKGNKALYLVIFSFSSRLKLQALGLRWINLFCIWTLLDFCLCFAHTEGEKLTVLVAWNGTKTFQENLLLSFLFSV